MKQVYVYKDPDNQIVISKDHYHGVVVQVVRLVDQLQRTASGEITQHRTANVVLSQTVKLDDNFKVSVQKAIEVAKNFITSIIKNDESINGLLNDYKSQNRELNEPDKQ